MPSSYLQCNFHCPHQWCCKTAELSCSTCYSEHGLSDWKLFWEISRWIIYCSHFFCIHKDKDPVVARAEHNRWSIPAEVSDKLSSDFSSARFLLCTLLMSLWSLRFVFVLSVETKTWGKQIIFYLWFYLGIHCIYYIFILFPSYDIHKQRFIDLLFIVLAVFSWE